MYFIFTYVNRENKNTEKQSILHKKLVSGATNQIHRQKGKKREQHKIISLEIFSACPTFLILQF